MLKRMQLSGSKFDDIINSSFKFLYQQLIFAACIAIVLGLIGTSLLFLFPTMDDDIAREILNSLVSKYHNLDLAQKDQIRIIFRDIFLSE